MKLGSTLVLGLGVLVQSASAETQGVLVTSLVDAVIPAVYDKQEDWGNRKAITVGLKVRGLKVSRRRREVKHGVWKHYVLRRSEGEHPLAVRITNARLTGPASAALRLEAEGKIDAWGRAKVYRYGVHLIALEVVGDVRFRAEIDCELALDAGLRSGAPAVGLKPKVTRAELHVDKLNIHRISNADGPVVRQLGDGLRRHVERELDSERLTAKLNRAIEKNQSRLELRLADLMGDLGPLAEGQSLSRSPDGPPS